MRFQHRIRTIYAKELVDILRDRRTLIAMIVVPIVLYPLLMLGSVQAVSYQADTLQQEELVVGVVNAAQGHSLERLAAADRAALQRERDGLDAPIETPTDLPEPVEKIRTQPCGSREEIEKCIRDRSIHIGILFDRDVLIDSPDAQNRLEWLYDKEDVRSATARRRLDAMIERTRDRTVDQRKTQASLPATFDQPFVVTATDLSAPPSILGQVLPLILILMTITGAIYPAIDLTAGERERGTLESLMVCPVPVIDLIVGKFLVVTTVAIMGAALNLGSVTATVYFGGFGKVIASTGGRIPFGTMVFILLCLIPFAVLMSAIMIAVCSYARTFKEAQNYVTPVILAVLIPGGIAALPATRLEGVMLVMPVGNMVLLARDWLLGAAVPLRQVVMVLLSTTLYAGAAVSIAANIFGRESVVFSDAGSLRSTLVRRLMRPAPRPSIAMSLLSVALLFPTWFFVQSALAPGPGENATALLFATAWIMPLLFVAAPVALLLYCKVDVSNTLALRRPRGGHLAAGVLIGLSAWVPAHELNVAQQRLVGTPQSVVQNATLLAETLRALPSGVVLLLIALLPAVCEELLFRGFLLSGLTASARKWSAILASAAVFGVFHFFVFKFPVTVALGVVLAYLCWQSCSIVPGVVAHALHNGISALSVVVPHWPQWIGIPDGQNSTGEWTHLPLQVNVIGVVVFLLGLWAASRPRLRPRPFAGVANTAR